MSPAIAFHPTSSVQRTKKGSQMSEQRWLALQRGCFAALGAMANEQD